MDNPPSLGLRIGLVVGSLVVSLLAAEVAVRLATGGAFRQLPIYTAHPTTGIALLPDAQGTLRAPGGHLTTVHTNHDGQRPTGAPAASWLVVGDSQVLGLGVEDAETFAAVGTTAGLSLRAAGVPGYGVEDALRAARAHLTPSTLGVLLVVNQANDAHEWGHPVEDRFTTAGGWLLPVGRAHGWRRTFFASPLAHLHLLHHLVVLTAGTPEALHEPQWTADVAFAQGVADAVIAFAQSVDVPVQVAFLPVDLAASPDRVGYSPFSEAVGDRTPWTDTSVARSLRLALPKDIGFVDLTPALRRADSFLPHDYHLSPKGHARVAVALVPRLATPAAPERDRNPEPAPPGETP